MPASRWRAVVAGCALLAPAALPAQDPPKKPVVATANVSLVDAAGNTNVTTLSGDQRLEYTPPESGWTLAEFASVVYGRTEGETSANALKAGARADRAITTRSETSLVAPLSARFAVKVAYTVRFDNLPEPGFEKTDRILSSGLQVTF